MSVFENSGNAIRVTAAYAVAATEGQRNGKRRIKLLMPEIGQSGIIIDAMYCKNTRRRAIVHYVEIFSHPRAELRKVAANRSGAFHSVAARQSASVR